MNRFRFRVLGDDYRPMEFPPEGPYWCTGSSDTHCIVVAFSPSREVLTSAGRWPDAEDIDEDEGKELVFTDRFPEPEWWKELKDA